MKYYFFAAVAGALALAALAFTGCANQATTAVPKNPDERTYSRSDLERTGQAQNDEALESADSSIQSLRRQRNRGD